MKKISLSILCVGLITLSNAAECKLILEPSDFQLDSQLKAPNESYAFSVVANFLYISNFRGYTQGTFCNALIDENIDKRRNCMKEISDFIKKDSVNTAGDSLMSTMGKNFADGYKSSSKAPITKEHLCFIQKKYKTKTSISRSSILEVLNTKQEKIRQNYLKASEIAGQSDNIDEIAKTVFQIENND